MDTIDPKKAAAVWQRVQGGMPPLPPVDPLPELIAQKGQDATLFLSLSRRFRGSESALLRKLAEQSRAHAACLQGISAMTTGSRPKLHLSPAPTGSAAQLIRHCYGRAMHALALYESRVADPQFGHVYQRLAQQERDVCRILLELLGKLPPNENPAR